VDHLGVVRQFQLHHCGCLDVPYLGAAYLGCSQTDCYRAWARHRCHHLGGDHLGAAYLGCLQTGCFLAEVRHLQARYRRGAGRHLGGERHF
jgi:hypothetical protein